MSKSVSKKPEWGISGFTASIMESYLRDFAGVAGSSLGGSGAVHSLLSSVISKKNLDRIKSEGKPAIRAIVTASVLKLESGGQITNDQAQNLKVAMERFLEEFVEALKSQPEGTVLSVNEIVGSAINRARSAVMGRLTGKDAPRPPSDASEAGAVVTTSVFHAIRKYAGSEDEFSAMMRVRSRVLMELYRLSKKSDDPRSDDAKIAFDFGYYGNLASNVMLISAVRGVEDYDERIDTAIAIVLNSTSSNHSATRASMKVDRAVSDVFGAISDAIRGLPDYVSSQVMPIVKLAASLLVGVHAASWVVIVVAILGWLYFLFEGMMLPAALCTVMVFVSAISVFSIPVQIVGGALSGAEKTLHFVQLLLSGTGLVPAPIEREVLNEMSELSGTESLLKSTRWRAVITPMGMQLFAYPFWVMMWDKSPLSWNGMATFALHVMLLGIVVGVTLKFEDMTSNPDAREYFRVSRRGLTLLMIFALGAIVLAKITGTPTSTPLTYLGFSVVEVGRHGLRNSLFQGVTLAAVLGLVAIAGALSFDMAKGKSSGNTGKIIGMIFAAMCLAMVYKVSVDSSPLAPEPDPLPAWGRVGMSSPMEDGTVPLRSGDSVNHATPPASGYEERRRQREEARSGRGR